MKENRDVQVNEFRNGLMLDASDMIMPGDRMRFGQNVRLVNRSGSSYVASNLSGTEAAFNLTDGFVPVAAQEFNGVLYIISWNNVLGSEHYGKLELGSYPSPDYSVPSNPNGPAAYRPLNNLDEGPFRTDVFGTSGTEKPIIQKLEIQPDYDGSVNMCFTIVGKRPRIVNTRFKSLNNGTLFEITKNRQSNISNSASSNTYATTSVNEETSLILFTTQLLKISFQGITQGGRLKPGNYHYVFYYMTEDFNKTAVVGESSTCQIAFGDSIASVRGGDGTEETSKSVHLQLTNIDTDFRYVKVYFLYSTGESSLEQQYVELVRPLEIRGTTLEFFHTGYEETALVSQDEVNIDYTTITSAAASTQVGGYYFLGNIASDSVEWTPLRTASHSILPTYAEKKISILNSSLPGYADPINTYNYLGYMSRETYAFGIVYIMKDGSLSPVFPVQGVDFKDGITSGYVRSTDPAKNKGLITFPWENKKKSFDGTLDAIVAKHVMFNVASAANNQFVKDNTIGFFFVRAERKENRVTQGILLPTVKVPTIYNSGGITGYDVDAGGYSGGGYYIDNNDNVQVDDINVWRHLINLDGIVEAFVRTSEDTNINVVNSNGALDDGYMPLWLYDGTGRNYDFQSKYSNRQMPNKLWYSKTDENYARHWALLSGEAIANEPEYVASLGNTSEMTVHQLCKVRFTVKNDSVVAPLALTSQQFGCHYDMDSYSETYSDNTNFRKSQTITFVAENSKGVGDFQGVIKAPLYAGPEDANDSKHYLVAQHYNSYYGVVMAKSDGNPNTAALNDATVGSTNPIGGNSRMGKVSGGDLDAHPGYNNLGRNVSAGFLVNIYKPGGPIAADTLYQSTDALSYRQVSPRYTWGEAAAIDNKIYVFGGDNYISKITRKLNHPPEADIQAESEARKRWNINCGMMITWWQESKYNLHLRKTRQADNSEPEKRSFYPFQSTGDIVRYRSYRLPETNYSCIGNRIVLPPKGFFGISDLMPVINNRFLNRIYHSEKHIPNAFKNGFRSFTPTNYRDYDSSMGAITGLFNHRGGLLVVFEHGVGITTIEQRIQTGADAAGAIFVEPSGVLPPTLSYISREIGCQDPLSFVQTPTALYGVDKAKDKIWMVTEGFKIISDEAVSSWLIDNPALNPRSGYDFENGEVIFTTDNWTLCYTEGMGKFTSFYTLNESKFYARRNKELYSFPASIGHKHNSASSFSFYGQEKETIVEFVVNKNTAAAKVIDYINIISNEVPPSKVEFFSYNQDVGIGPTIDISGLNQYSKVEYGVDPVTEEHTMMYRDKKYVVQVGERTEYLSGMPEDIWGWIDNNGRVRDKAVMVRLTYLTDKPLELASVLSYFRYSQS